MLALNFGLWHAHYLIRHPIRFSFVLVVDCTYCQFGLDSLNFDTTGRATFRVEDPFGFRRLTFAHALNERIFMARRVGRRHEFVCPSVGFTLVRLVRRSDLGLG